MATYDDPRILRAIAHPTRNRLLAELSAHGASRAADLAGELALPANQASFHLRQLAKYGLVEEAPELARDKRDRVWKLVDEDGLAFRTRDIAAQPGGASAVAVFQRNASAHAHTLVDLAYSAPEDGVERVISDDSLRLSNDEVLAFHDELREVVRRWRQRGTDRVGGVGAGGDDASAADDASAGDDATATVRTTYSLFQLLQPFPALPAGEDDEDGVRETFTVRGFGDA